jgi:hypothetical protein
MTISTEITVAQTKLGVDQILAKTVRAEAAATRTEKAVNNLAQVCSTSYAFYISDLLCQRITEQGAEQAFFFCHPHV